MSREKVELHTAYSWDCPQCGRESFVRAVVVELTPDDVAWLTLSRGEDAVFWDGFFFASYPDKVICSCCGKESTTILPFGNTSD